MEFFNFNRILGQSNQDDLVGMTCSTLERNKKCKKKVSEAGLEGKRPLGLTRRR
jgi:hypothetical protein